MRGSNNARKKTKYVFKKGYIILIIAMAVITLLVTFLTSFFETEQYPVPDIESPPESPPSVIIETPVDINDEAAPDAIEEPELPPEDTIISINEIYPEFLVIMDYFSKRYTTSALSFVLYDSELSEFYVYQYGFRDYSTNKPVDLDTKFCVASLSKLVTAICAMTLVEDEILDLDKDISEYLGYEVRNPHFPDTAITTGMLLRHTSSIFDPGEYIYAENKDSPEATQRLLESGKCFLELQPGSEYNYSPFLAYSVVALICEIITEKRFDTIAREALFVPMGIDAAYLPANLLNTDNIAAIYSSPNELLYSIEDQLETEDPESPRISDHDRAGANLMISAIDYTKIIDMLCNRGVYKDINILSEESVIEVHRTINRENDSGIGMGVFFQSDRSHPFSGYYYHIGSAWGAQALFQYFFDENTSRSYVILATGTNSDWASDYHSLHLELSIAAMQFFIW